MLKRITINPDQCGGHPCIRGMRIRVIDILELLANGLSVEEILKEMPDLEMEDIQACIKYENKKNATKAQSHQDTLIPSTRE